MNLRNIAVHKINKEQNGTATIEPSSEVLSLESTIVQEFSEKLAKTYFGKKSRFYTSFYEGASTPIFRTELNNFLEKNIDLFRLSEILTDSLKNEMTTSATGGYLVLMDYISSNGFHYLFVALLNNKEDFHISDTLALEKFLSLNIEHMAMASVINMTKYIANDDNYITFLKGLRDIPDYFISFVGADRDKRSDLRAQTKSWVDAIDSYLTESNLDLETRQSTIDSIMREVKRAKDSEEIVTADTIANIVKPTDPDSFISFIYDEDKDFQVNPEMEGFDNQVLKQLSFVRYEDRAKGVVFKFKKELLNVTITVEDDKIVIIDRDIIDGIKAELRS